MCERVRYVCVCIYVKCNVDWRQGTQEKPGTGSMKEHIESATVCTPLTFAAVSSYCPASHNLIFLCEFLCCFITISILLINSCSAGFNVILLLL